MNQSQAEQLLRQALADENARFRQGQWEAIDELVNHQRKLMVVQRTGWGKSSVYFISSRIFRDRGMGPTIIVSPLLALMRNQISSATRLGLNAVTMNSANQEHWPQIVQQILADQVDCLLISPERLANDEFVATVLMPISDNIGLMVIDEAHCISDWGHDFRPDYRRIINILRRLPPNTPVLATTATANNRVVEDIQNQLGDLQIQRGSLQRESLILQNLVLPDQATRLAWLAQYIPQLPGTGIVYTLTTRDAEQVAEWLRQNEISAQAYHGNIQHPEFVDSDNYRQHLEQLLLQNKIKVLVATTALGMGYDKPDLGFVIHYQAPGSIVAYYQQVGRAGRAIEKAFGILMTGAEDDAIHDYFRRSAFPSKEQIEQILQLLVEHDGLTVSQIEQRSNLRQGQIEKVLKLLGVENPAPVIKIERSWRRTAVPFEIDRQRMEHLTQQRESEWGEVQRYLTHRGCLMRYLREALDDRDSKDCGHCAECQQRWAIGKNVDETTVNRAVLYLRHAEIPITPRKQTARSSAEAALVFVQYKFPRLLGVLVAQEGRVLSRWGDAGWGKMVAEDKLRGRFRDQLVEGMAEMIVERWRLSEPLEWVCAVPSLRHPELVPDFARRLAQRLGLPYREVVMKVKQNQPQKQQQNSFHQCCNLDGAFAIELPCPAGNVLLVDDVIDSGWTLTVIAALLQQAGSGLVYPVALASTSVKD